MVLIRKFELSKLALTGLALPVERMSPQINHPLFMAKAACARANVIVHVNRTIAVLCRQFR